MSAEQIFKDLTNEEKLKDIPIIYISRITLAVLENLIDKGCLLTREEYDYV